MSYAIIYSVLGSVVTPVGYITGEEERFLFDEQNNPHKYRDGVDIKNGNTAIEYFIAPKSQETLPVGLTEMFLTPNQPTSLDYFAALESLGGSLTNLQKAKISIAEDMLKITGIWNKIHEIWLCAGGFNSCLLKWKYTNNSTVTNNGFVSGDYSSSKGLTGDGIAKYIGTNYGFTANGLTNRNITVGFYSRDCNSKGSAMGQSFNGNFYIGYGTSSLGASKVSRIGNTVTVPHHTFDGCVTVTANASECKTYLGSKIYSQGSAETLGNINGDLNLFNYANSAYYNGSISAYYVGQYLTDYEVYILTCCLNEIHEELGRRETLRNGYFGDSTVWGVGDGGKANVWTTIVNNSLGGLEVNLGIGGTVFQDNSLTAYKDNGFDRFDSSVLTQELNSLYILYGLNDLRYNGVEFTPELYKADLDTVVKKAIINKIPNIYILSPTYINPTKYSTGAPFNGGSVGRHEDYVQACQEVASDNGVVFIDAYTYLRDNGGNTNVGFDGIHLSTLGNSRLATYVLTH